MEAPTAADTVKVHYEGIDTDNIPRQVIDNEVKRHRVEYSRAGPIIRTAFFMIYARHAIVAEAIDLIVNLKGLNDMLLGRTAPGGGKRRGKKPYYSATKKITSFGFPMSRHGTYIR
mgnify:CR=1 FL=1